MRIIKVLFFVFTWSSLSLMIVFAGLFLLISSTKTIQPFEEKAGILGVYAESSDNILSQDARPRIVEDFLRRYQSTLEPYDYYAQVFVDIADKHNLDFRLMPAIAMQESNLCRKAPKSSNNCWGHGIYGGKILYYETVESAIESVAQTLDKYSQHGLASPEEIMRKYTPGSDGSWAAAVLHFMAEMR